MSFDKQIFYGLFIVSFILTLHKYNRKDKAIRVLSVLLCVGIVSQFSDELLRYLNYPRFIAFHLYSLLEYPLYSLYFYKLIQFKKLDDSFASKSFKSLVLISVLIYVIVFCFYYMCITSIFKQSFGFLSALNGLFVTMLSLYFYVHLIKNLNVKYILTYPHFYIVSANLIFFCTQIPLISLDQFLIESDAQWRNHFINIYKVNNFALYILYCIGLSVNIWEQRKLLQL